MSVLRTAYKDWLVKDRLVKLNAQIIERNGMKVPVVTYQENNDEAKAAADKVGREFRAGATAHVTLPAGVASFELVGGQGTTVDPLPAIKYHDQAMSKSALAMFLDLGHDAGLGSGQTTQAMRDIFTGSLQAVADTIADTATEHIIRDLVEHNYGPDEAYPVLTPGDLTANQGITDDALAALMGAGAITYDTALEDQVRSKHGIPERKDPAPTPTTPTEVAPVVPLRVAASEGDHLDKATALLERIAQLRAGRV